jgi:hypothetical protein
MGERDKVSYRPCNFPSDSTPMVLDYIDLNFGCKSGVKIRGLKHRRLQFFARRPNSSPIEHVGILEGPL